VAESDLKATATERKLQEEIYQQFKYKESKENFNINKY
jgi:hypothetical protein